MRDMNRARRRQHGWATLSTKSFIIEVVRDRHIAFPQGYGALPMSLGWYHQAIGNTARCRSRLFSNVVVRGYLAPCTLAKVRSA